MTMENNNDKWDFIMCQICFIFMLIGLIIHKLPFYSIPFEVFGIYYGIKNKHRSPYVRMMLVMAIFSTILSIGIIIKTIFFI